MNENPADLLPELLLLGGALATLVLGLFTPRRRQYRAGAVAGAAVLAALIASIAQWSGPTRMAFEDSYRVDGVTGAVRCIVTVSCLLLLALFRHQFAGHARETEAYVLLLLAALGAVTLAGANDLLLLMGAFTLASVPLYALTGFGKDSPGTEAAMKYYLMGALFGIVLLTGITVLFGLAGQSAYPALPTGLNAAPPAALVFAVVAIVAGLSFKTGAVPVHFWVPDVAEGAGAAVAAAVTTLPKVGGLAALYRLFDTALPTISIDWRLLLAVVAVGSMTLGNFAAFFQDKTRRLLGYSTISQVGYLMMPLVVAARVPQAGTVLLFYLAGYALTNIGAFAVVAALPDRGALGDYRGLGRSQPALIVALIVCLLGFIGTPPLAIFIGKLTAFTVAIHGGYTWLAIAAAVNTVASIFYYLRWIAPAVTGTADATPRVDTAAAGTMPRRIAYLCAAGSVAFGVVAGTVFGAAAGL